MGKEFGAVNVSDSYLPNVEAIGNFASEEPESFINSSARIVLNGVHERVIIMHIGIL